MADDAPFEISDAAVQAFLKAIAAASPLGGASGQETDTSCDPDLQARNLAAFTTASAAMSETYLALFREQIAAASAALEAEDPASAAAAWFSQMAEAAQQAGAGLQAQLLAEIANSGKDP